MWVARLKKSRSKARLWEASRADALILHTRDSPATDRSTTAFLAQGVHVDVDDFSHNLLATILFWVPEPVYFYLADH
jgi:hypothetical protein